MNTLYLRLPSMSLSGSEPHWGDMPCAFALVSHDGTIARQGEMPLPELSVTIVGAQRVVLLVAAADVALLHLKVPPLSHARLKAALPNLVEDLLIGDPRDCVVVAGGAHDGLRSVAAIQRNWLEHLASTLIALGARRIAALPAQLCLAHQPDTATAAVTVQGDTIDLTVRLSGHEGLGLTLAAPAGQPEERETQQTAAHAVIHTLNALIPETPIALYVPQDQVPAYQQAAADIAGKRIGIAPGNWTQWLAGAGDAAPDLMAGLGAAAGPAFDWRSWRWPAALAVATLLVNIIALNFDWWRKNTEANALRASMIQIYKTASPKETVILDPIAQTRQKIAAAKRAAGLPSPGDFTVLAAAFGKAWGEATAATPGKTAAAIAAIEYRERSLIVRLKPGIEAPQRQLETILAKYNLTTGQTTSGSAVELRIRSAK